MKPLFKTLLSALLPMSLATGLAATAAAEDVPYDLAPGKPYEGTTLNILSVVTPQFDGLMLRDDEFTELTGIETEWTFIPFTALQEKGRVGRRRGRWRLRRGQLSRQLGPAERALAAADRRLDDARDGISMDRYPGAFAKSAQFEGKTLGFPASRPCDVDVLSPGHLRRARVGGANKLG